MALDLKNPGNKELVVFGGGALLLALLYFVLSKKSSAAAASPSGTTGPTSGTAADNQTFLPGGASPSGNAFTDALFSTPATASPGATGGVSLPSVVQGAVHSTSQGASAVLPAGGGGGGGGGFPTPLPGGGGAGAFGSFATQGAPTPLSWAMSLLKAGGFPQTAANLQSLISWALTEAGGGARNPLNTTQPEPGSTVFNSKNVQNFPSWATGIQATVKTLYNGYYPNIVADLKSGKGVGGNAGSNLRTWSGNGYSAIAGNWARAAAYLAKPQPAAATAQGKASAANATAAKVTLTPALAKTTLAKALASVGSIFRPVFKPKGKTAVPVIKGGYAAAFSWLPKLPARKPVKPVTTARGPGHPLLLG
jgi:hypothetical protein